MGLFDRKKKKIEIEEKKYTLYSITNGKAFPLEQVSDEMFSKKILGDGIAFESLDGAVYAPCSGVITTIMDTGHALAITSTDGAEILIHIGFDTVKEGGEGFAAHVSTGDKVNAGELIVTFDKKKLEKKGYDLAIPMIIINCDKFPKLENLYDGRIEAGVPVLKFSEIEKV